MVQPGIVLDALNAQLQPHGLWFRSTCRPARRRRSAAWRATTRAARARSRYGNMVHNVLAIDAVLPTASAGASARCDDRAEPAGYRELRRTAAGARTSAKRRRSSALAEGAAQVAGYNLDHLGAAATRNAGAPARRLRRHARLLRAPAPQALAAAAAQSARRRATSRRFYSAMELHAAHREARARRRSSSSTAR